jgi:hypothetical protein
MTTPRLTRRQWGAIEVDPDRPTRVSSTKGSGTHWVGPTIGVRGVVPDHSTCATRVRAIQRSHMAGQWYDIAYNEVVCPHGTRYEGRGHNVQTGANGSAGANAAWYAILALVGQGNVITRELLDGLYDAHEDYRRNAGAGLACSNHRDLLRQYTSKTTECPGDVLYGLTRSGRFNHRTAAPTPPTITWKEPGMKPVLVRVSGTDPVYLSGDRVTRRWIVDGKDLETVRRDMAAVGASTTVRAITAAQLPHYGVLVGPTPKGSA